MKAVKSLPGPHNAAKQGPPELDDVDELTQEDLQPLRRDTLLLHHEEDQGDHLQLALRGDPNVSLLPMDEGTQLFKDLLPGRGLSLE